MDHASDVEQRLREVWHGTAVSEAALAPPKPSCLVSPDALADLEATKSHPLLLSKRGAQAYFDQLELPQELRSYFGRPSVLVSELMASGLSLGFLQRRFVDQGVLSPSSRVIPACRSWP